MAKTTTELADLLEYAWTIICNAGGGDWEKESQEWRYAARKLRGLYLGPVSSGSETPDPAEPITASEAVYAFAAWLTTRPSPVTIGAANDCAIVAELVDAFCKSQGLPFPRDGRWDNNLKPYPGDSVGSASDSN